MAFTPMLRTAFLILALALCPKISWAQTSAGSYAVDYFPDKPPSAADLSRVPAGARDVIIAKVRIIGRVYSLGGRHPWDPPQPRPKHRLGAEVEIVHALGGDTRPGARYHVSFGVRGGEPNLKYPHTHGVHAREYFTVSYVEDDGRRRLLGFPVSQEEYAEWEKEIRPPSLLN